MIAVLMKSFCFASNGDIIAARRICPLPAIIQTLEAVLRVDGMIDSFDFCHTAQGQMPQFEAVVAAHHAG